MNKPALQQAQPYLFFIAWEEVCATKDFPGLVVGAGIALVWQGGPNCMQRPSALL